MAANGVLAMCLASWSSSITASTRFSSEGSPSRVKVDEVSLNKTIALPAMGIVQKCGEERSKKIKNGGEDERRRRGLFLNAKSGENFPFYSSAHKEIKSGHLRDFKYEI